MKPGSSDSNAVSLSGMPQIASAKKRVRVTARQTAENRVHSTRSRTALKRVRTLIGEGKTTEAMASVATAHSYLDKAAKKGAFHANTAARYKSRLAKALKDAGGKDATPKRSVAPVTKAKTPAKTSAKAKPAAKAATAPKKTPAKKPAAKKSSK